MTGNYKRFCELR